MWSNGARNFYAVKKRFDKDHVGPVIILQIQFQTEICAQNVCVPRGVYRGAVQIEKIKLVFNSFYS